MFVSTATGFDSSVFVGSGVSAGVEAAAAFCASSSAFFLAGFSYSSTKSTLDSGLMNLKRFGTDPSLYDLQSLKQEVIAGDGDFYLVFAHGFEFDFTLFYRQSSVD